MDLKSIVHLLNQKGDELLEQDRKNRVLLDELLQKHKKHKHEVEKQLLALEERPTIVRIAGEGEPAIEERKKLEARKAKHKQELTELKFKNTLMEREREIVTIELERLIEKLNNLSGNQSTAESILVEAIASI